MRIGIIGTGSMGKNHLRVVSSLDDFRLTCAMDTDRRILEEACRPYPIALLDDYRRMTDLVDGVMVSTPTVQHYSVSKFFLEQKKHVLVEKPITCSVEEADELITIAGRTKTVLAVGHIERFNPALQAAFPLIRQPRFMEAQRLGPFSARSLDIDVIQDLMIHDLDILLACDASGVKEIRSVGVPVISSSADIANVRIEFYSGLVANITASRVSQEKTRKLRIFQNNLYISVDYKEKSAKILRLEEKSITENIPPISPVEPLANLWRNFYRTVREGGHFSVSGVEGRNALELALRISRSLKKSLED